jgi:hypothetical protein
MLQCAEEGNLLMLIWLFEKDGCNVEDLRRADDAGITPLQLASMRRGKDTYKILLTKYILIYNTLYFKVTF